MNLVLLCICSIFLARVMEGKMKVASIAHSILFIFMAMFYLLTSNNEMITFAMKNIFGEHYYSLLHNTFTEVATGYTITMFALFIVEFIAFFVVGLVSLLGLIKAFKYILKSVRVWHNAKINTGYLNQDYNLETGFNNFNKQNTYLVLSQLRN